MASALESLAPELLDLIVEYYGDDCAALALLMRCSKLLYSRLQPVLYRSPATVDRAMRRGCKTGNVQTIRVAILYGADVSTIGSEFPCSTFMLAAERGHVKAFDFLIEQGAKLDSNFTISRRLSKSLCLSRNAAVLHSFLKQGFASLPGVKLSLCWVIRGQGSPDAVGALLDHGLDVNRHERIDGYHLIAPPLSVAIMANAMPIVDLLIERGADIHGTEECSPFGKQVSYPFAKPLHLPIFAAAITMARGGCTKMMQRCLDLGADINRRSHTYKDSFWPTYTTPLLMYLEFIRDWDPNTALRTIDGLKYLLKRGASLELPDGLPLAQHPQYPHIFVESTIEVLLDKWGLEMLADDEFFATIKFLVENGAGKDRLEEILTKYRKFSGNLLLHWPRFVALLTKKHFSAAEPAALNELLQRIILRENHHSALGEMDHLTVRALLQAGADINASIDSDGHTILHQICSPGRMRMFSHICSHKDIAEDCKYAREKYSEFSFLRDIGADPDIVANGKSSIDILLELGDHSVPLSGSGKDFLVKLGNILLGEGDKYRSFYSSIHGRSIGQQFIRKHV